MLQLLVTIPLPVWGFDFRFRHATLGGWLSLVQLGVGVAGENSSQHIALGSEISRIQTPALFVLPQLCGHYGRFPVPDIGSL